MNSFMEQTALLSDLLDESRRQTQALHTIKTLAALWSVVVLIAIVFVVMKAAA